ncbi:MAG: hypothetical protein KF910_10965 [Brevundimonas sp.]|uniref:hypothetical protein n=1 Tax=Brevundimonas sp. TaxID=1871086 RepID=UPI0025BA5904|nr:hypothetical protein [Brevundimonas sp.]MBX3478123.1 hypothetical protein [Brevundimonas sp.]
MLKTLIPAAAALGLAAFAVQSYGADPATEAAAEASPAMGWHLSHEGTMAKLAYGVANSDQLAIMMTCEPGATQAVVYGEVQPLGARLIQAFMTYPAAIDPMTGGLEAETRIGLNDPALTGLARDGVLPVGGDAGRGVLPATKDERRLAAEFLAYCGARRA